MKKILYIPIKIYSSLSIASALQGNTDIKTEEERVKYAVIINFFVGIVYIIMGFVHLGNIIDYIQTPIISGKYICIFLIIFISYKIYKIIIVYIYL